MAKTLSAEQLQYHPGMIVRTSTCGDARIAVAFARRAGLRGKT